MLIKKLKFKTIFGVSLTLFISFFLTDAVVTAANQATLQLTNSFNIDKQKLESVPADDMELLYYAGKIWFREAGEFQFQVREYLNPYQEKISKTNKPIKHQPESELIRTQNPEQMKKDPIAPAFKKNNFIPSPASKTLIWCEDFEGNIPGSFWETSDTNPLNELDYWDDYWSLQGNKRIYSGNASLYCADISDITGDRYDNNMCSYFKSGRIDLTDWPNIQFCYHLWYEIESNYDSLTLFFSGDGQNWSRVQSWTGKSEGNWQRYGHKLTGFTDFYFMWQFFSDHNVTLEGAYIDSIAIYGDPKPPSITIKRPIGNEFWASPGTRCIRWTSYHTGAYVKIQYTTDNEVSWKTITNRLENRGQYYWTIPKEINSKQCKVRIEDADTPACFDESDHCFAIKPMEDNFVILESFDSPAEFPRGLAADGRYLWQAEGRSNAHKIFRLNRSGASIAEISFDGPVAAGMTHAGEDLFVVDGEEKLVYRIVPETGANRKYFNIPVFMPWGIEWNDQKACFWISDAVRDTIYQIDFRGNVIGTIPAPGIFNYGMAFDGEHLWLISDLDSRFYKLNPVNGQIIDVYDPPAKHCRDLSWDGTNLWTASEDTKMISKLILSSQYQCVKGDINMDGVIDTLDLNFEVKIITTGESYWNECSKYAADTNCDGKYNIFDLQTIINAIHNQKPIYCQSSTQPNQPKKSSAQLILPDITGRPGEIVNLAIGLDIPQQLSAFSFDLSFPPALLEFQGISRHQFTDSTDILDAGKMNSGKIRILGYTRNNIILNSSKEIVQVQFKVKDDASGTGKLDVTNCAGDLKFAGNMSGSFTVMENSSLPGRYRLSQNYPNPFNMKTQIGFQIPSDNQVRICIYNIQGKLIRNLKDSYMPAGEHSVSWDGKNDQGQEIASGVYFYQLETNDFSGTKKLLLIK